MSDPVEDTPLRRWSIINGSAIPDSEGRLMLYADHVAAVQAERERIRYEIVVWLGDETSRSDSALLAIFDGGSDE